MSAGMDKAWFSEQIINTQDSMYRYAFCILKNDSDTKDAIQDAIIKAYENLETLNNPRKFKSWIMVILRNCAYDLVRKQKPYEELEEELTAPDHLGTELADKMDLYQAIQKLSLVYRTTILLYYYESMSVKEISRIMEVDTATVRKRLSRARTMLKEMLE